MTDKQKELARHALGLPNKFNMTYRNHFCVDKGNADYAEWEDLVAKGLATRTSGGQNWVGDFFYLTLDGARAALLSNEHLSPEDARKMRSTA